MRHEFAERGSNRVDQNAANIFHVRDGRVSEVWELHDDPARGRQVGVSRCSASCATVPGNAAPGLGRSRALPVRRLLIPGHRAAARASQVLALEQRPRALQRHNQRDEHDDGQVDQLIAVMWIN